MSDVARVTFAGPDAAHPGKFKATTRRGHQVIHHQLLDEMAYHRLLAHPNDAHLQAWDEGLRMRRPR